MELKLDRPAPGAEDATWHGGDILLEVAAQSDTMISGITQTPDGRFLAPVQGEPGSDAPKLARINPDRTLTPWPDAAWNAWKPGDDPTKAFVGVVSVRIGPDGLAWVVDKGSPGFIAEVVPGGPKLVGIDVARNEVAQIYPLDDATKPMSLLDDVRFNGRMAYITDAFCAGIVVLDLDTGEARRVLEDDPSTTGQSPLRADGRELRTPDGGPLITQADQLEVSPDGKLFYFQPTMGPMSVIETRHLNDATLTPEALSAEVRPFAPTRSTGGTAMDAAGNIYVSHTDDCAIVKVAPDGTMTEILRDAHLQWPDAMWIDETGGLLAPASQMNRGPGLNDGTDLREPPYTVYRIDLGLTPLRR